MTSNFKATRNLQVGFGLSLFFLLIISAASYFSIRNLLKSSDLVAHSNVVVADLEKAMSVMKDAETGQRGYLLTGETSFLQPYNGSYQKAVETIEDFRRLTVDNPQQQANAASIKDVLVNRLNILQQLIEKKNAGQTITTADLTAGKSAMDMLRLLIKKAEDDEKNLLALRIARLQRFTSITPVFLIFATALSFFISCYAYYRVRKEITERLRLYAELEIKEEETATFNEELAATNEELNASNEELRQAQNQVNDLNEELGASNEELSASNEELRASMEELARMHHDLVSLNEQLEAKVEERTADLSKAMRDADNQRNILRRIFMQAPSGICILNGPELVYDLVNPAYQKLVPERQLLNRPIFEALPELAGQPIQKILRDVYNTGETYEGQEEYVPLTGKDGKPADKYFNFIYQARRNAGGQIDGILVFAFDVTDMVINRKLQQQIDERFKFLLNAIPQQVWTGRPDGTLDYVNDVVCDDFGHTAEDIIGNGWQSFIHPDDLPICIEKWLNSLETGAEYMVEFRLLFADGNYYWHLGRAISMVEDEKITLWVGTNTNIQSQKDNEQRKDEFLSIASHELKTPLTSIKAFNQLLQRVNDPEIAKNILKRAAVSTERLGHLINDLLDVTRINAGKIDYNFKLFNFSQMLEECVENFRLTNPDRSFRLENIREMKFMGDQPRLEQVLQNFLSNAVKYSPDGGEIIVRAITDGGFLVVSVQDFGIGIDQQHIDRLFDRYYRIDNTAMRFEGLGLGLFISADILRRHNGAFSIESEIGKGSTFYFRLPLQV